jgi:hypothetical protein
MSLFTDATLILSLTANAGLGIAVAHLVEQRRKPKPTPRPRAENRNKQVTAPAHTEPAVTATAVLQPDTQGLVIYGDVTEERPRLRLMPEHVDRGVRARGGRAL